MLPRPGLFAAGELAAAVTGVASALRAGSSPAHAWLTVTGIVVGPHGVPALADLLPAGLSQHRTGRGLREQHVRRARAVVAAGRLAAELGTPLGPVLDRVARTLESDEELDADRRAALAGPRSTATVLRWLPVLGVVLGAALGADPLGVLLDGGLGATSALAGAVLLGAGHVWTRRLVLAAQTPGDR
ncbi:type II secretion system F family protein [Cellulomonas sp. NS3]|uniref:type II secretion system F family protein n=1 Tax=Cellulomonas sp. NS3 TaxID=2973977 RepID=UPI002163C951|nr:type II secretion protein F [Cellulomonas sp. NS3]